MGPCWASPSGCAAAVLAPSSTFVVQRLTVHQGRWDGAKLGHVAPMDDNPLEESGVAPAGRDQSPVGGQRAHVIKMCRDIVKCGAT